MQAPEAGKVALAWVRVIQERPVSLSFAEKVGVKHESPQAVLVKDGKGIWSDSHSGITADALKEAVARV